MPYKGAWAALGVPAHFEIGPTIGRCVARVVAAAHERSGRRSFESFVLNPRKQAIPRRENRNSSRPAARHVASREPILIIQAEATPPDDAIRALIDEWLVPALVEQFLRSSGYQTTGSLHRETTNASGESVYPGQSPMYNIPCPR